MSDLTERLRRAFAAWGLRSLGDEAADEITRLRSIEAAAIALLADVRARYPGEALRCPFMIALDHVTTPTPRPGVGQDGATDA